MWAGVGSHCLQNKNMDLGTLNVGDISKCLSTYTDGLLMMVKYLPNGRKNCRSSFLDTVSQS